MPKKAAAADDKKQPRQRRPPQQKKKPPGAAAAAAAARAPTPQHRAFVNSVADAILGGSASFKKHPSLPKTAIASRT